MVPVVLRPSSSTEFIESALSGTGMRSLSYKHQKLKWLIRQHLLSLLEDFPTFTPSKDTYVHNDGTVVWLLNVTGYLTVPPSKLPVLITIWLQEKYPYSAPQVYISSHSAAKIDHHHPFIDPASSGSTHCPYLETWKYPGSNLSGLTRELVQVLSTCTPYPGPGETYTSVPLTERDTVVELLVGLVHHDKGCFRAQIEGDIEHFSGLQNMLRERAQTLDLVMQELENEWMNLKIAIICIVTDADQLRKWLGGLHTPFSFPVDDHVDQFVEPVDERSKCLTEREAADRAIDDVMEVMGQALEEEGIIIDIKGYLKQCRTLAREQFFHRALIIKLET
ncbi:hypothetical protein J5N97_009828 [Dioscorea zingiberensis]|uniref:UEV domain-containing protein n=1 Tax=Dioscorea zingiberensis TaxID=325984 RepID=A0A9D5HM81_9LILI|nr:hypothetical protein J5N97_009828 [Dioscorea zingiberensis]